MLHNSTLTSARWTAALEAERREEALRSARVSGAAYGRHFGTTANLARAYGARVELVAPSEIARLSSRPPAPGRMLAGLLLLNTDMQGREHPVVYVAASLPAREQRMTTAHEVAHLIHPSWDDRLAESFAAGFVSTAVG